VWFPGVHCDVGGSYEEEELANITLQWMIGNAKTCGLAFDDTAVAAELAKAPFDPAGKQHESWQVVPWGMPKNRVAPANAVLSNTVAIRAQKMGYKPLALSQPINTYATFEVIPAAELQPV
jgi:hypothetical protein